MSEQLIKKIETIDQNKEITDEELARQLQAQFNTEIETQHNEIDIDSDKIELDELVLDEQKSLELAMNLQKVYDAENFETNGASNRFLADRSIFANTSENDDEDYYYQGAYNESDIPQIHGKELHWDDDRACYISKHDKLNCDKNNVRRLEDLPNSIDTGRMEGLTLDSKTFNSIKQHSHKMRKQHARLHEGKSNSTAEHAIDENTRLVLYKWVNSGLLKQVNGVISIGKEAVILHADGGKWPKGQHRHHLVKKRKNKKKDILEADSLEEKLEELDSEEECEDLPENLAIKIFKTSMAEFKNRKEYMVDDQRFKDFSKVKTRQLAPLWAEKEVRNLRRMEKYPEIKCPKILSVKDHILVMEFIGESAQSPAPKLAEAVLKKTVKKQSAYDQSVEILKLLWHKAKLVHADFSAYNLLWFHGVVYVIDTAQAVESSHPKAIEFLTRDCENITDYFRELGLDVVDGQELVKVVTGEEDLVGFLLEEKKLKAKLGDAVLDL